MSLILLAALVSIQMNFILSYPDLMARGDYNAVYVGIQNLVNLGHLNDSELYYIYYPHQIFSTLIYGIFNRILVMLGFEGPVNVFASRIFNVIMCDIGIVLLFFSVKNIMNNYKVSFLVFLTAVFNISYYGMVLYLYPHSLSVFFISFVLFAASLFYRYKDTKYALPLSALMGFAIALAKSVEGIFTVSIVAVIIWLFLNSTFKVFLKRSACLALAFLLTLAAIELSYLSLGIFTNERDNREIPVTHWIMMGLSEDGIYNEEDYVSTVDIYHSDDRTRYNLDEISSRLNSRTALELLTLIKDKLSLVFVGTVYGIPIFNFGHTYDIAYRLLLFMLALAGALINYRKKGSVLDFFNIWAIGIFLFVMLWEASPTYLFSSLPLYIILSAAVFDKILRSLKGNEFHEHL